MTFNKVLLSGFTMTDKTKTFNDLPGADPSVWCHVCGMPRSDVDPLVDYDHNLLCHMCAFEASYHDNQRLTSELAQARDRLAMFRRVALAYRWDRNDTFESIADFADDSGLTLSQWIHEWSQARRADRRAAKSREWITDTSGQQAGE